MTLAPPEAITNHFTPYPSYRPTGVDWLPEVPTHWSAKRLKFLCELNPSKAEVSGISRDTVVSFVPMEKASIDGKLTLDEIRPMREVWTGYTYFHDGDILVAKITPCFENGKGAYCKGLVNEIGFGTTEFHVIRPSRQLNPEFLFYLTKSHPFREMGTQFMSGVAGQQRVADSFIRNLVIGFPDIEEQRTIVTFLDRETARIDTMIEKKERLIALLEEKRTAFITHAVTKGLNPNVPMKDSGICWLGYIPKHWSMKRLKFVAFVQTGLTLGKKYNTSNFATRPYLRVANVQDGYLDLDNITTVKLPHEEVIRYQLCPGDVLMTEGGDFDKLGRGYVWEGQVEGCLHQNHVFAVRPDKRFLQSLFLVHIMNSLHGKTYFTLTSQQTTNLACTNSTKLKNFCFPLPPMSEQREILTHIELITSVIGKAIRKNMDAVTLLQEYRAALISAAVTGTIDVRKECAHVYD